MNYIVITCLTILSVCSSRILAQPAQEVRTSNDEEIIPLSVGNSWAYIDITSGKKQYSKVEKEQIVNGMSWFKYNEFGDSFWVKNIGKKQYEAFDYFDLPSMDNKTPLKEVLIIRTDVSEYTFEGILRAEYQLCREPLKVPAGIFNCHIITFHFNKDQFSINYYAEGVGLIKNIYSVKGQKSNFELVSYDIK